MSTFRHPGGKPTISNFVSNENRRYFYPLEGEGIRHQLLAFSKAILEGWNASDSKSEISIKISSVMEDFYEERNMKKLAGVC